MTKRIFHSIFGVALVMIFLVVALVLGMMLDYSAAEQEKTMRAQGVYVATGLEKNGISYLEELKNPVNRITWMDADGVVLFDSHRDATKMENHKDRAEFILAQETGEGFRERYSKTLSEKTMNYALRLDDGGVIRISSQTVSPITLFFTLTQPLAIIIAFAIGLSIFLASQTSKYITKPINDINLEQPELAVAYDELTPLLRRIAVQNKQIHKQMKELKRQKQEFDTITSNMQEGLLVLDGGGSVLSYNEGALQLMEIKAPELMENVFILNRSAGFRRCVEKALGGNHHQGRIEIGDKICEIFANPVAQEDSVVGVILVLLDVTEREGREKLRREFTANVSHELKTPLTSISGFAEIMQKGMVKAEDVPKFAGNIYQEAQRLIRLVQDIIKLSKLDEKETTLERETVSLDTLVEEVVHRLTPIAQKKGVSLVVDSMPISFVGVSQVLQEMIYNLVDNGIRYNKTSGAVNVCLKMDKGEIILSVADTGIGIAKTNQKRVFERFYRVCQCRSKETEGTGLGLSIVKHGVLLHGGHISLQSELDQGTTITVYLPLQSKDGFPKK